MSSRLPPQITTQLTREAAETRRAAVPAECGLHVGESPDLLEVDVMHEGKAAAVAAGIRRRATSYGYSAAEREGADACADYLTAKKPYLDYATALTKGWPIATGVIEGACRHLVADRMDITGARWGLDGAEAILKLRALASNGDFDTYWCLPPAQRARTSAPRPLPRKLRPSRVISSL
jgi:hypothetical protein